MLINAGTAGGLDGKLEIFVTVIAAEAAYHDVDGDILTDFHPWLPSASFKCDRNLLSCTKKAAQQTGYRIFFGKMVTGEQFIEEENYVNQTPFVSVRTITDTFDHKGLAAFGQNCEKAAQLSADIVCAMLKALP